MDTITGGGERPRWLAEKMSQALVHFARTGDPNQFRDTRLASL